MEPIVNIAGYKFARLSQPEQLRAELSALCGQLGLKGTILVSGEGINVFAAGERVAIDALIARLRAEPHLGELSFKESFSAVQPFGRMRVKCKREIVPGNAPDALDAPAPRVSAAQLKQWLDAGVALTLLDTRNAFEVALGTFRGARHLQLANFREFPEKAAALEQDLRDQPIVTFCTGGIRCEKAALLLLAQGFRRVHQLDGGILEYFNQCGGAHYEGDCFVFDERVALTPQLTPVRQG